MQAAFDASQEIGFTIVSMTLSLAAVCVPFLFLGGIVGRLFREFAVTIAIAILVSGVVSLTLTPMLASRWLRPHSARAPEGRFYRVTERVLNASTRFYDRTLQRVLRHPRLTLAGSFLVLVASVVLFVRIPKGFLPTEDIDQLSVTTEAVEGISFQAVSERQQQIAEIVRGDPDVEAFMSSVGSRGGRGSTNQGSMILRLRPKSERERSALEIARELGPRLGQVPGMRSFISVPPAIRLGGRQSKSEYQLTLQGTDTQVLYEQAPRLAEELAKSPAVADVTTDVQLNNPEIGVNIDRERAAQLGVSVSAIEETLYTAYGSRQVSTIFAPSNSYQVILELDPRTQRDPSALEKLYVRSDAGALVPLTSVATLEQRVGPLSVNHTGQLPSATVSFNVRAGHALSDAIDAAEQSARRVLPEGVTTSFQGSAEAFQSSLGNLGRLLLISVFVIYLVLGVLYESTIHPLTILSALPFAGFGALLSLELFGFDLNVYAFVGVILLVGLVKKNGIMMVDFAVEASKDPNKSARDAIHEACLVRFRPIMMTTLAALLGTLPIALGQGAGAESRQPLGVAVVGGLLFSQLLTLYVTPVFYLYMDEFRLWLARLRRPRSAEASWDGREAAEVPGE
jgi:HAE1 family hydrophobic/amphiphilic exporter-1